MQSAAAAAVAATAAALGLALLLLAGLLHLRIRLILPEHLLEGQVCIVQFVCVCVCVVLCCVVLCVVVRQSGHYIEGMKGISNLSFKLE